MINLSRGDIFLGLTYPLFPLFFLNLHLKIEYTYKYMGGFFGTVSKAECVTDLFYGTDYNSHMGTKRAGMGRCSAPMLSCTGQDTERVCVAEAAAR